MGKSQLDMMFDLELVLDSSDISWTRDIELVWRKGPKNNVKAQKSYVNGKLFLAVSVAPTDP